MKRLLAVAGLLAAALGVAAVAQAGDAGTPHYPDLITETPFNAHVVTDKPAGKRLLRFANAISNVGQGPFELHPVNDPGSGTTVAYQRVYTHDAQNDWSLYNEFPVGTFVFHPAHNHWHFEGFALYQLRSVAPDGGVGRRVWATSDKVSFCMVDTLNLFPGLEHAAGQTYASCNQNATQGISVGWADVYGSSLPGQSLDITNVPSGTYWLVSIADPYNVIAETSNTNNVSKVLVTIRGSWKPKQ